MSIYNHTLLSFIAERYIQPNEKIPFENVATDALGFVLNRSEAARQALSDVLRANADGVSPIQSVETQYMLKEGTPDLACRDAGGEVRALVEAKFFGGPTPHQPGTYWNSLPINTPTALVFLVPTRRLDNWRQVLIQSLRSDGFSPVVGNRTPDLVSMRDKNSSRCLILISWDELLRRLQESAKSNEECQTSFEVAQLRSLVKTTSSKVGLCLFGCGEQPKGPKRKYCIGHSSKVASLLKNASKARPPYTETVPLPDVLVEHAKANPKFEVHGFRADKILHLAAKVGVRET